LVLVLLYLKVNATTKLLKHFTQKIFKELNGKNCIQTRYDYNLTIMEFPKLATDNRLKK